MAGRSQDGTDGEVSLSGPVIPGHIASVLSFLSNQDMTVCAFKALSVVSSRRDH